MRILSLFGHTLYWCRTPKTRYSKSERLDITFTKKSFRKKIRGAVQDYLNKHPKKEINVDAVANHVYALVASRAGVPGYMKEGK